MSPRTDPPVTICPAAVNLRRAHRGSCILISGSARCSCLAREPRSAEASSPQANPPLEGQGKKPLFRPLGKTVAGESDAVAKGRYCGTIEFMHVLLAGFGTWGDVQPMVALARALGTRGHVATVAGPPDSAARARELGAAYVPVGESMGSVLRASSDSTGKLRSMRKTLEGMRDWFGSHYAPLASLVQAADLVVGATMAAAPLDLASAAAGGPRAPRAPVRAVTPHEGIGTRRAARPGATAAPPSRRRPGAPPSPPGGTPRESARVRDQPAPGRARRRERRRTVRPPP
jgi:hypothetical protein